MAERVARAVFGARWDNHPEQRPELLRRALLAIAAMREPTAEMIAAGSGHTAYICWEKDVANCFRAMIDQSLDATYETLATPNQIC